MNGAPRTGGGNIGRALGLFWLLRN